MNTEEEPRRLKRKHIAVTLLKYTPILVAGVMMAHCLFMYYGYENKGYAEAIGMLMFFIVLYLVSQAFGFCLLQRMYLVYSFFVAVFIFTQQHFGLSERITDIIQISLTAIFCGLFIYTLIRKNGNHC